MILEVELALEVEGVKLFRVRTIKMVRFPNLDPTRKVRFGEIFNSISHCGHIDWLGVSGSQYGTCGRTWPRRWIGGRLRWIGRGVWGGLMGCRHVEYFGNRCWWK